MKLTSNVILLISYIGAIKSSIYSNLRDDVLSYLDKKTPRDDEKLQHDLDDDLTDIKDTAEELDDARDADYQVDTATKNPEKKEVFYGTNDIKYDVDNQQLNNDVESAQKKAEILIRSRIRDEELNDDNIPDLIPALEEGKRELFRIDPVMNSWGRRRKGYAREMDGRRKHHKEENISTSVESSSSSQELKDWKQEFREQWLQKKFDVLNQSIPDRGDQVNMVAARPWGVPCGDPNQHDMPWGTCMLAMECEAEYRIYRGDSFCGRTRYVCCALQLNSYDMYQGFDVSLDDKSLSTDSDEKKDKNSEEKRKKKKKREKKRRKKNRDKRKRKIRKTIRKIIKEIRKLLNKQYKNGTRQRKKKTELLKKFVKKLKKQYKKDRQSIADLHEEDIIKIDTALMAKLYRIKDMNQQFMWNATFRNIITSGKLTRTGARMLVEAYPELQEDIKLRRSGGGAADDALDKKYFEYDVEYGYVYE